MRGTKTRSEVDVSDRNGHDSHMLRDPHSSTKMRSAQNMGMSHDQPEHRSRSRRGWSPHGPIGWSSCGAPQKNDQNKRLNGANTNRVLVAGCIAVKGGSCDHRRREVSSATSEYSSGSDSRGSSVGARGNGNTGTGKKSSGDTTKDEIVHFTWQKGMILNSKFEMLRLLGDGTFGRVVLARDKQEDRQVAIKIIRDVKRYRENAKIEADILKDIQYADPHGSSRCAVMYESFMHDNRHFCLVFEPLGVSLYDFLKTNTFRGFWVQDIQSFARQCLKAMNFLHHKLEMTHTDLKPENILLQSMETPRPSFFPREAMQQEIHKSGRSSNSSYFRPANSQIKLIDFGNATYKEEHHSSTINTRQYRGPEVVLQYGWNERSDIWSLGCIFMELYTGELLFGTHDNLEHLALMEKLIEPLPPQLLSGSKQTIKEAYLRQTAQGGHWRLCWPERASSSSASHVRNQRALVSMVLKDHELLLSCVVSMLKLDPLKRPSASAVLSHRFFCSHFDD